jgi:hypothetical protein
VIIFPVVDRSATLPAVPERIANVIRFDRYPPAGVSTSLLDPLPSLRRFVGLFAQLRNIDDAGEGEELATAYHLPSEGYLSSCVSRLTIVSRTRSSFFMRTETVLQACNTVP